MAVKVSDKQHSLKKEYAGIPDGGCPAEDWKQHSCDKRLNPKYQECRKG